MADESKLVEKIVFGPSERVNYIVYEAERLERMGNDDVLIRERVFKDKQTGVIISRSYLGKVEKTEKS